jgi:hypothetical protein
MILDMMGAARKICVGGVRKLAYKCMFKLLKNIFIDCPRLLGIEE